jgi:hypothetical protein
MEHTIKKGTWVRVWSLQSFHGGGFLKGEIAFLRQSSHGKDSSLMLCVVRNIEGEYKVGDSCYEVYRQQCEILEDQSRGYRKARVSLRKKYREIMANEFIK